MPVARHPYQKVAIDTAPLIDALTLKLIEREPKWEPTILRKSRLHSCLADNPTSQRNFRVLLNSIEEIVITSHVIGEIRSDSHLYKWLGAFPRMEIKLVEDLVSY